MELVSAKEENAHLCPTDEKDRQGLQHTSARVNCGLAVCGVLYAVEKTALRRQNFAG